MKPKRPTAIEIAQRPMKVGSIVRLIEVPSLYASTYKEFYNRLARVEERSAHVLELVLLTDNTVKIYLPPLPYPGYVLDLCLS